MARKVTKTTIYNNLESFAAFVEGADAHPAILDGKEIDAAPMAFGAQAMALYVMAAIDGEIALDNDMEHLASILVGIAIQSTIEALGQEGEGDDE